MVNGSQAALVLLGLVGVDGAAGGVAEEASPAAGGAGDSVALEAGGAADEVLPWSRKSVTYQPLPFNAKPAAVSCLARRGCPH